MRYDLIIIGGGPAGITAGIYAARQKLNTLLITKSFGGQIAKKAVAIENYPGFEEVSGLDLIRAFEKHLRKFTLKNIVENSQIDIERDEARRMKKINNDFLVFTKSKQQFRSKAVIIASGADPRPLEVPGEKEFIGKGISYCVTCDAPLFADKKVAVVGGGNSAFETAEFLSSWANKVYILEYQEKVGADVINQQRTERNRKIKIITSVEPKEIKGGNFVNSLVYSDRKTGKESALAVDGVFIEIGSQPATSFVNGLVDFSKKDEIIIDPLTTQTKTPGLFAAGDVTNVVYKQIVIAAGEGCKAALSASSYLISLKK